MRRMPDEAYRSIPSGVVSGLTGNPPNARILPRRCDQHCRRRILEPAANEGSALADQGLQPGDHIGPYELRRRLGAGGMDEVLLARRAG